MLHVFSRQCDKQPFTKVARAISSNLVGPYMNVTWIPQFQHNIWIINHPTRFVDRFLKRSSAPWLWHCHTIQNWHSTKARPFSSHYLLKLLTCFPYFVHVESESALKVNNFKLCQVTSTLHRKFTSVSDFWVHLFLSAKGCWFCRFLYLSMISKISFSSASQFLLESPWIGMHVVASETSQETASLGANALARNVLQAVTSLFQHDKAPWIPDQPCNRCLNGLSQRRTLLDEVAWLLTESAEMRENQSIWRNLDTTIAQCCTMVYNRQ